MAKAYLGKISALVTANTSDFNSKLNASAKEVRSFASSMQSALNRAETSATSSLRGIYTEAQKLERALKAASSVRLSFKGVETGSLDDASRRLQQLFSVTQSITKPLEASSKAFGGLSAEVQAGFLPALISAQKATESITATINKVGSVGEAQFAAVERKVIETTAAISRLREASSAVGSLATGQELRFQRPDFVAETQRSAALQSQISQLSPQQISGGGFADLVSQQRAAAVEAERLAAALERARLARGGDVTGATAAYDAQIARQRQLNDQIEREINLAGEATAASRRRAEAASQLLRVNQSESTLLSNQGAASTTDATGRSLQQRLQDIARLRELEQQAAQATLAAAEAQEEAAAATRRRVDAASRLLQINQSESTLLSNQGAASTTDATGRSIQQRIQDIARLREAEASLAREREVAANVGASSQLASTVDPTGRSIQQRLRDIAALREAEASLNREREIAANVGSRSQRATILPNDYFSGNLARNARESLGAPLDAGTRQLEIFRSGIVSAKNQLDAMPAAIRLHFIPAIQGAEQEFVRLAALGPRATAEEIENASRNMDVLAAAVRRTTQASQLQGFGEFIDSANVRQATGELQALQQILVQVEATAGGPAARAYETYRQRLQAAIEAGETGLPRVRQELVALQREAARAAAETGRISFGAALRRINRGGDIARGGFDNFSLAINQAAFAIDDFFSSTGGLEFKLRAISNNITQLAFILGGTTGLFVGLGAVIGGQVLVALTKWVNGGRTAEDQTKALNEALSRQKSLVEELARAFSSLGDSLTRDAFSPAAQKANDFRRELDEIVKKQKELREARVADLDPTVQRERATQGSLQRRLESETNIGRRVDIQQQLEQSRRREREAAAAAASRQAPTGRQAQDAIEQAGQALFANRTRGQEVVTARDTAVLDEARARAGAAAAAQTPAAIRDLLTRQRDTLVQSGEAASDTGVANAIARLEELIAALEAPVRRANDALVIAVLEGAKKVSDALAAAQSSIANADFGPSRIATQADAVAKQLESLANQLETATDEKTIQALKAQQAALLDQSTALRSAATSVKQFASVLDRVAGDLAKTVLGETESSATDARRRANAATGARQASDPRDRIPGSIPDSRVADEFRRRSTVEAQMAGDRERAEENALEIRNQVAELEERRARAIRDFERQPGAVGALAAERDRQQAIIDSQTATADEKQAAKSAIDKINSALDAAFERSNFARSLSLFADAIDATAQALAESERQVQQVRESAARGRESFLTPQQRRTREIEGQLNDAQNAVLEDLTEPLKNAVEDFDAVGEISKALEDGVLSLEELSAVFEKFPDVKAALDGDLEAAKKNLETMRDNFMENSIAGQMARSVRNAVLQGPSRAALNASDVTTSQGQQELNRLLRGDDAARDVDMVEMQKQTGELEQINKGIKDLVTKIGVAG